MDDFSLAKANTMHQKEQQIITYLVVAPIFWTSFVLLLESPVFEYVFKVK